MSVPVVDREHIPILGRNERAEQLCLWSSSNKAGSKYVHDTPFGLRLGFVSDGEEPKVYLHWNQQRFWDFYDDMGKPERVIFISWGICIEHYLGRTTVTLLGAGQTSQSLWDSEGNAFASQHSDRDVDENVNWLVGMLRMGQQGPTFHPQHECQQELEEATALAVIRVDKKKSSSHRVKSISQVLPAAQPLSLNARQYLLRDLLVNTILKQQNTAKTG